METSQKSKQKKLTVFMARVELKVRFPGQWLLLYVAAEEGNARVPDLGWGGVGGPGGQSQVSVHESTTVSAD